MHVRETGIAGLIVFEPSPHRDERGWFSRTFDADVARRAGVDPHAFLQDSQSRTVRGGLRGLHGRVGRGEAKLVRCAHGAIVDVVVDARPGSATMGRWESFRLDDENLASLYIPRGCLHGFQALTQADTCYRIDAPHDPGEDVTVAHDDPELAVDWPLPVSVMSAKDRAGRPWSELTRLLGAVDGR
jgi:dTDP-4-dehydrorhamnose 3,5-epimerase